MGLFGHKGPNSSTSTTTSTTWNSSEIENFMNSWNPSFTYINKEMADVPQAMQDIINYETSSSPFERAQQLGNYGKRAGQIAYSDFQKLHGLTGDDLMNALTKYSGELYSKGSDFMATQDQAIEDSVNAQMGSELAQSAEVSNNNNGGTYTSGALSQKSAIVANSAESMETQESKIADEVMSGAVGIASNGIRGAIKGFGREIGAEAGVSGSLFKAAAKSGETAISNAWNASVAQFAHMQKQENIDRQNDMVNENMYGIENAIWLQGMLATAGIDTTSTTNTHYSY